MKRMNLRNTSVLLVLLALAGLVFVMFGCGAYPPTVSISISPSPVVIGSTAMLSCEAESSTGKTLTYAWAVSGGSLSSSTGRNVSWTAPSTPGTFIITVTVSDGTQTSMATINVTVISADAPVINSLTASPSTVSPGMTTTLSCDATDPNGKTMTYSWTASAGMLGSVTGKIVTWTAPTTTGTYQITCTVTNGSTSTSSTLNIITSRAPTITNVAAVPSSLYTGQSSVLTCTATDAAGATLTYSWTKTDGTLSSSAGNPVTWTAPAAAGTYTITTTVNNGVTSSSGYDTNLVVSNNQIYITALTTSTAEVEVNHTCTVSADAHNLAGKTMTYSWESDDDSILAKIGQSDPVSTWRGAAIGNVTVKLTVSDGTISTSLSVGIEVK